MPYPWQDFFQAEMGRDVPLGLPHEKYDTAVLVLADGTVFEGYSVGASGSVVGEMVFHTAHTGYQEILTDPSYCGQCLVFTYPHIGNVGINPEDQESHRVWLQAVIMRDVTQVPSSWRSRQTLSSYLQEQGVVAMAGVDTRALTLHLRDHGAQNGCVMTGVTAEQVDQALKKAQCAPSMKGQDLASVVTVSEVVFHPSSTHALEAHWLATQIPPVDPLHIVVLDLGVKTQIMRWLVSYGCRVTRVPAHMSAKEIMALKPHGVLLSNGPGDPAACSAVIETIRRLMQESIPLFGICLGCQLLGLAAGAKTFKMIVGHHGANHPVLDVSTKEVLITSQNHGFAIHPESLPEDFEVTHVSLFDGTVQGIQHRTEPWMGFQGHPEASPGPHEAVSLYKRFIASALQRFQTENLDDAMVPPHAKEN